MWGPTCGPLVPSVVQILMDAALVWLYGDLAVGLGKNWDQIRLRKRRIRILAWFHRLWDSLWDFPPQNHRTLVLSLDVTAVDFGQKHHTKIKPELKEDISVHVSIQSSHVFKQKAIKTNGAILWSYESGQFETHPLLGHDSSATSSHRTGIKHILHAPTAGISICSHHV